MGRNILVSFKPPRPGNEPQTLVKNSGANHYPRASALRDRKRDNFQNRHIFVTHRAGCRAGVRASQVPLVVAFVCGQSRDFSVSRRSIRR